MTFGLVVGQAGVEMETTEETDKKLGRRWEMCLLVGRVEGGRTGCKAG